MNTITCQVLTIQNEEEIYVGRLEVYIPPRAGEYIWFSEERKGHSSWIVEEVAHHVGDGKTNYLSGYQHVTIFVKPTAQS